MLTRGEWSTPVFGWRNMWIAPKHKYDIALSLICKWYNAQMNKWWWWSATSWRVDVTRQGFLKLNAATAKPRLMLERTAPNIIPVLTVRLWLRPKYFLTQPWQICNRIISIYSNHWFKYWLRWLLLLLQGFAGGHRVSTLVTVIIDSLYNHLKYI